MVARVVGVRFREAAKMYHFAPPAYPLHVGDYVVVETARGSEMARVVTMPEEEAGEVPPDAKAITRLADQEDRDRASRMRDKGEALLARLRALIAERELAMYAVAVQVNLAGAEATCYFQADVQVDFRSAVELLESEFSVRLHMQQAGPRDRAKLVDGHDICGLRLCCSSWMTSFPQVGIRMAKEQNLALNPDKISGVCGRLFCCLTFEYDVYREMRGTLPKVGKRVSTPAGMGRVKQVNVLKETVTIEMDDSSQRVEVRGAEIGMAVRVEEAPNQALADAMHAVAGETATAGETVTAGETATAGDREPGGVAGERAPRRRRRRKRPEARSEEPAAEAAPAQEAAPAAGAEQPPAAARPRRRRRRRRRGRESGDGGATDSGAANSGAAGPD